MDVEILITSLGSNGEGIGSYEGLKIFVEGALPGERALVTIKEQKSNYAIGSLKYLNTQAPNRVQPLCPLFGSCGGCHIMHLAYDEQLNIKRTRVLESLKRIGHLDVAVERCIPSPSPLAYRNKIQLPVLFDNKGLKVGLYRRNTHEIIPISKCFIQCEAGEKILHEILPHLQDPSIRYILIRNALHTNEALIILVTTGQGKIKPFPHPIEVKGVVENRNPSDHNTILSNKWKTVSGRPYIYEELLGKRFKISAGSFFQVNTLQAENLYKMALLEATIQPTDTVIDAYCGVGTLSLFASDFAKKVIGIEEFAEATQNATENALINNVENCTFYAGKTEKVLETLPTPDVIFLNPPRKGCERKVLENQRASRIVYVSCDPATLARDLAILVQSGYKIEKVQPFDMFPQTMHVETLVKLIKY